MTKQIIILPSSRVLEIPSINVPYLRSMKKGYVYLMTNKHRNVLYAGVTNNLWKRVEEHRTGAGSKFTKKYNAVHLIYSEEYDDIRDVIIREKEIKLLTRAKKNMLIESVNPEWKTLEI